MVSPRPKHEFWGGLYTSSHDYHTMTPHCAPFLIKLIEALKKPSILARAAAVYLATSQFWLRFSHHFAWYRQCNHIISWLCAWSTCEQGLQSRFVNFLNSCNESQVLISTDSNSSVGFLGLKYSSVYPEGNFFDDDRRQQLEDWAV